LALGQVAGQIVDRLGVENACYWLDQGTEHPHRIALNVRHDKVAEVTKHLEKGFQSANVQVRPFSSPSVTRLGAAPDAFRAVQCQGFLTRVIVNV
jgi:hypothetical protein